MTSGAITSKRVAVADMNIPTINVAIEIVRLKLLTLGALNDEWRRLHITTPPKRMSRDLLMRGITYKIQERRYGGPSTSIHRKLAALGVNEDASSRPKPPTPISLKAGARLVREWRGVTYSVLVHRNGFEWRGKHYRSLTTIAKEITGAHWSGQRFFGLRKSRSRLTIYGEAANAQD